MSRTGIPDSGEIIDEAMGNLRRDSPGVLDAGFVRGRFSDAVEEVFRATYETYRRYEHEAVDSFAEDTFLSGWRDGMDRDAALAAFKEAVAGGIRLEKSLSQSRSSRAGKSFETIVKRLLAILGIPSEAVTRADKKSGLRRIDLVIPDRETAIRTPDKAHFLSLKTSLRERWREVVEEQTQGQRTRLLTILQNEIISNATAMKIVGNGIILYVPDRVKDDRFAGEPGIRRLSDLPQDIAGG